MPAVSPPGLLFQTYQRVFQNTRGDIVMVAAHRMATSAPCATEGNPMVMSGVHRGVGGPTRRSSRWSTGL